MEIYYVNFRVQSEYKKTQTRKNTALGHFSHIENHSVFAKFTEQKIAENMITFPCFLGN